MLDEIQSCQQKKSTLRPQTQPGAPDTANGWKKTTTEKAHVKTSNPQPGASGIAQTEGLPDAHLSFCLIDFNFIWN